MVVRNLAGDDGQTFVSLDQHGLVPRGVAGRWEEPNAGGDLVLAINNAIGRSWEVDPMKHVEGDVLTPVGVATGVGGVPLGLLDEDGDTWEQRVSTDVVEVEMAVDHDDDLGDVQAGGPAVRQRSRAAAVGRTVR